MSVALPALLAAQQPYVPYVPTPHEVVRAMLDVARVDSTDVVYDLGSGDGRIVIAAAQRHGARGLGVDIDTELVAVAMRNAQTHRVDHLVEFRQQDLFELDLSPASVVTLYLLSDVNLRLRPRLLEQLRPGSRVVSHAFDMRDWQPDSVLWVPYDGMRARVFYWVIPARVDGTWKVEVEGYGDAGPLMMSLQLAQRFQMVDARTTDTSSDTHQAVGKGRLRGSAIELDVELRGGSGPPARLIGTADGDAMRGVVHGTERRWTARRVGR